MSKLPGNVQITWKCPNYLEMPRCHETEAYLGGDLSELVHVLGENDGLHGTNLGEKPIFFSLKTNIFSIKI